jgi:DNA-binding beta-propeller fold protein YncE
MPLTRGLRSGTDSALLTTMERHGHQATVELPAGTGTRLLGYVFGTTEPTSVSVFDAATLEVLATKPLPATVRWLSNEQQFWDGRFIWTYDFPDNKVEAIAIDPRSLTVAHRISTGGVGPAHSLMLSDGGATAWVNAAGSNEVAILDTATGEVMDRVQTGEFP